MGRIKKMPMVVTVIGIFYAQKWFYTEGVCYTNLALNFTKSSIFLTHIWYFYGDFMSIIK
jgi:hypothetical protein